MKLAVIACDVLSEEVRHFCEKNPAVVRIEVIEQGLHNTPLLLKERLQTVVDRVEKDPAVEAIALVYGLCSRGIEGVCPRRCRMAVARAHDCITLFLGSKERYASYLATHPGTYWYSPGWNRCHVPPGKERIEKLRSEYLEKYGEENADYLMEVEQDWLHAYNHATFVDLGVGDTASGELYTRQCARELGWTFDRQQGDARLLQDLLSGHWDSGRFLVLEPGQTARFTADDAILAAAPCPGCSAVS